MTPQQKIVYRLMTYLKGSDTTMQELSKRFSTDSAMIGKRLPELEKAGLVARKPKKRKCKVTGVKSNVWVLVE